MLVKCCFPYLDYMIDTLGMKSVIIFNSIPF